MPQGRQTARGLDAPGKIHETSDMTVRNLPAKIWTTVTAKKRAAKRAITPDVWKSAGQHLLGRSPEGWLTVTPAYLRAYWCRPEVHPLEGSCANEIALHEALLADPLRPVSDAELNAIADPDAVENYQAVLVFRDVLTEAGTIEGAYLRLIRSSDMAVPPVFMDQMVHLIVRNMLAPELDTASNPLLVRAAELFFREQTGAKEDGRLLLTDDETMTMLARAGDVGHSQLLVAADRAPRELSLEVLDADNQQTYWARSDQFDTVLDFSIGEPGLDALSRVMERWLRHMLGIDARIEPHQKLDDQDWRWHIGLDPDATRMLNALYEGGGVGSDVMSRIVGLFRLQLADSTPMLDRVKGRPIYLGMTMTTKKRMKMQPQNLLINLPLSAAS
jgi:hypothetical protein